MKKEKQITPNELARMISKGFEGMDKGFEGTKKDTQNLRIEMNGLRIEMNERFDKVEKIILTEYRHRLEQVEKDLKVLKSALAI